MRLEIGLGIRLETDLDSSEEERDCSGVELGLAGALLEATGGLCAMVSL